jgi:hypothetical protein
MHDAFRLSGRSRGEREIKNPIGILLLGRKELGVFRIMMRNDAAFY